MTSRLDAHKPEAHRDHSWKYPVRAATSSNGNFTTSFAAGQGLDGVTLVFGDRILIKDQSTGSQNGIYVAQSSNAPVRAYDMDTGLEAVGSLTFVIGGTINGGKLFKNTNTGTVTIGSTALTFAEISSSGGISYATPSISLGSAAAAGAATTVIRSDSTIAAFDATVPVTQAFGDTAATGSAAFAARRDHKHGMPAAPATGVGEILISDTPSTPLVFADLIQNEAQTDLVYADP